MIYKIVCVGKIKETYYTKLIDEYIKKLSSGNSIIIKQVKDEPIPKGAGEAVNAKIIKTEGARLLANINNDDYVIALCIDGEISDTEKIKKVTDRAAQNGYKVVAFVIGGSLGLDDACIKRADYKLSFSRMTYPHQLMRVMLAEQISFICDM